jgi:hypothetical protein
MKSLSGNQLSILLKKFQNILTTFLSNLSQHSTEKRAIETKNNKQQKSDPISAKNVSQKDFNIVLGCDVSSDRYDMIYMRVLKFLVNSFCRYSLDSFIYRDVNRALRLQETETAWKFGFFIKDLHEQLLSLHANVRPEDQPKTVWRGQL